MISEGLTFDDVLLVPQHTDIDSRSKVDISVVMGKRSFKHPIIPANMKTVMGEEMARHVIQSGGLAILHRFMLMSDQIDIARSFGSELAVSVGVKQSDREMVEEFYKAGTRTICIDIAHGDSKMCIEMISWIKQNAPDMFIIAGNIATAYGARRLWMSGADAVKVGVGSGSLCTTRIETGNGVPQLSAIMNVHRERGILLTEKLIKEPAYIISDGGCREAGDLVKSLCFADMVMTGNLFAGCEETPGDKVMIDGVAYKQYVGSSTHKANHIEGVAAMVPYKGYYQTVLTKLVEGIQSGMSYQGAHNLAELRDNPEFVRITNAGLIESHPHNVVIR
jgi:IMP dehydrogenase/GMP reductase